MFETSRKLPGTVITDPASDRRMFTEGTSINATASAELETQHDSVDPEEYERALADASSMAYQALANDLIDSIS